MALHIDKLRSIIVYPRSMRPPIADQLNLIFKLHFISLLRLATTIVKLKILQAFFLHYQMVKSKTDTVRDAHGANGEVSLSTKVLQMKR
jgi:hypothetical protein